MTMELVEVVQADRDAAADLVRYGAPGLGNGNTIVGSEIKGGLHDQYEVVQTFARHRIASSTVVPGDVVALAAKALAKFADSHMRTPGSAEHWEDRLEHNREYFLSAAKAALSVLPIPDRREELTFTATVGIRRDTKRIDGLSELLRLVNAGAVLSNVALTKDNGDHG